MRESIDSYYGEYKIGGIFGKKYMVKLIIYKDTVEGEGYVFSENELSSKRELFSIPYGLIKKIEIKTIDDEKGVFITCKKDSVVADASTTYVIFGLDNELWLKKIKQQMERFREEQVKEKERIHVVNTKMEKERIEKEKKASDFYNRCYKFVNVNEKVYHPLTKKFTTPLAN